MIQYCALYIFLIIIINSGSACWYSDSYKSWQCSNLEEVLQEANETWSSLQIFDCLHLRKDNFIKAPNVAYLECQNVESIEQGSFNGLHKLDVLRLFYLKTHEIPSGVFDNLPVGTLLINESDLKYVQPGLFEKLPFIYYLVLTGNKIEELQDDLFSNTNIRDLSINRNKIVKIGKKAFANMNRLIALSLNDNIFTSFTSDLYTLDKLFLLNNNLYKITTDMLTLTPNLLELYVMQNQIETIDLGAFKDLPKIELINLHNNSLTEVKRGIFDNTNIHKLFISNNRIEYIAENAFENMINLIEVSLRGNLLTTFNTELYFGGSDTLRILSLSNNYISEINKYMFTSIPNLEKLNLDLNQINVIKSGSFNNILNLKSVDISNNKIRSLEPRIFPYFGMKNLIYLTVHNNQLTYINRALFLRIPNLEYITYAGNPFQCPCHIQLTKLINKRNITRICDQDYLEGQRPVCVFSSEDPHECLYDEDLTEELYDVYTEAVQQYPKLELKCDETKGYQNAFLNIFENVR